MFGCKQMGLCRIISCSSIRYLSKRIQTTSCTCFLDPPLSCHSNGPRRDDRVARLRHGRVGRKGTEGEDGLISTFDAAFELRQKSLTVAHFSEYLFECLGIKDVFDFLNAIVQ